MDFNIIECVLLAIVTFIFAIDQFSLTEIVYRPIIACPYHRSDPWRCKHGSYYRWYLRVDDDR